MHRYDAAVRTTVDLPDDVHSVVSRLARDRGQSLSRTLADLVRLGLAPAPDQPLEVDPVTGLGLVRIGRRITSEDVAAAVDDD